MRTRRLNAAMRIMLRAVILAAALLMLSSCAQQPFEEFSESLDLTLCLDPLAGEEAARTAEAFAESVRLVSDGKMTVTIIKDQVVIDSMRRNSSDIFLVANETASNGLGDYAAFSSPYYFNNYEHMTMALNSASLGTYLNARTRAALGVEPMAALYNGSRVFIHANSSPVLNLTDMIENLPSVLRTSNGVLEDIIKARGLKITDKEKIVYNFERRRVLFFDYYKRDMGDLVYPERVNDAYLVDDFHIVDINWLMISADSQDKLTDWQKAVIKEAVAVSLAQNDAAVLEWESEMLTMFRQRYGELNVLTHSSIPPQFRTAIRESGEYINLWDWDIYDEVRNIAS